MSASTNKSWFQLWTANKVPYVMSDSHPSRGAILAAMSHIEAASPVWFGKRRNEPNWIEIIDDESRGNSSEAIGMRPGKSVVNIKRDPHWALHELCHVVGLIHEQSRCDSQTFIETFFSTETQVELDCVTIPANPDGVVSLNNADMTIDCISNNLTGYDRLSVMQYAQDMGRIPDTTGNSMVWRQDHQVVLGPASRSELSELDKQGIEKLYESQTTGWSDYTALPKSESRDNPGLAEFSGKLYAAWNNVNKSICYAYTEDGTTWCDPVEMSDFKTQDGLALAVFNGRMYAAWKGPSRSSGVFYSSTADGTIWTDKKEISNSVTPYNVGLTAFNGRLYVAWNEYDDRGVYYASTSDGEHWSARTRIRGVETEHGLSLATMNGRLYAAWNGKSNSGIYYVSTSDGITWSGESRAGEFGATHSVAVHPFHDPNSPVQEELFLTWKGSGDRSIWWAHFDQDQGGWSGQTRTDFRANSGPALAEFQSKLYMVWAEPTAEDRVLSASFTA